MKLLKTLAAASVAFFMLTAPAQADTTEQLALIDDFFAKENYQPTDAEDVYETLEVDDNTTNTIQLEEGRRYAVAAVCDNDCTDIDLSVYDKYGDEVDIDDDTSDVAIVEFEADYSGDYDVEVTMYQCATDYCYYRTRIYQLAE